MAIVQFLAIADVLIIGPQLIDTTLWLLLFLPMVVLAIVWVGQAVNAYRRAIALGGAPGGELQLAILLPLLLAVFTSFWLIGGRHATPASTFEAYMAAWESNRPDLAEGLFQDTTKTWMGMSRADYIAAQWESELGRVSTIIDQNRAIYGPASGLDTEHPFLSLRAEQVPQASYSSTQSGPRPVRPAFEVFVVRTEQYTTTLLGIIPTTGQRTVVVAPVLYMELQEDASAASSVVPTATWKIGSWNDLYPPGY